VTGERPGDHEVTPAGREQFTLEHMAVLRACQGRSESLVARHFRIPALPSSLYPYEVVTSADMHEHERVQGALAHLLIYERPRPDGVEPLYRICLQDDAILRRARELAGAGRPPLLSPLLCYILTHEIVHVVRFQRAEQSYLAGSEQRVEEEAHVHRTALEILGASSITGLDRLERAMALPVGEALGLSGNEGLAGRRALQVEILR